MLKLPFEIKPCPQECGKECGVSLDKCPIYPKLPAKLQEVCKENPHLLQYLHALPLDKIGIPEYYEKVNRSLKGKKDPNLIYKVGGGVFIHVLANHEDIRDHYIAIEPSLVDAQDNALDEIELRLADYVEELEGITDSSKRLEVIMGIVDRLVVVRSDNGSKPAQDKKKNGNGKKPLFLKSQGKSKTRLK